MCKAGLIVVDYSYLNVSGYENAIHNDSKIRMEALYLLEYGLQLRTPSLQKYARGCMTYK